MGRGALRGDFWTSVLWHLLSCEKEDGRCCLPSRPSLRRLALPTCPIGLGRANERDHHCGTLFTDCVRMVHFERSVLLHLPTSSMVEVVQDPKAIFKVSRQKTALAPAQEYASSSTGSVLRGWLRCFYWYR